MTKIPLFNKRRPLNERRAQLHAVSTPLRRLIEKIRYIKVFVVLDVEK